MGPLMASSAFEILGNLTVSRNIAWRAWAASCAGLKKTLTGMRTSVYWEEWVYLFLRNGLAM